MVYTKQLIVRSTVVVFCLSQWLLAVGPGAVQPQKPAVAKVTLVGKEGGVVGSDEGGKKERFILFDLGGKTKIKISSQQDVAALHSKLLEDHRKLTSDFTEKVKRMIQANDFEGIKQAEKAFKAASDELLQHLGYYTVEGTMAQVNDELILEGELRLYAYKGADKAIAKNKALVEGTSVQVKGKDDKTTLGIFNGAHPVLVTGKAAQKFTKEGEKLRVFGALRAGPDGQSPIIEADRIERAKK